MFHVGELRIFFFFYDKRFKLLSPRLRLKLNRKCSVRNCVAQKLHNLVEKKEYDPAIQRFKLPFGVEGKTGWFWAYFKSD